MSRPNASNVTERYLEAAGRYVQLTRDEFEDWLNSDAGYRGKWSIKPGTTGVYLAHLSDTVAIAINSTVSRADEAVRDVGRASMSVKLVSRITGRTLNRKAQGQSHFQRTKNWRTTWLKGLDRMKAAYLKSQDFYDEIAGIEDRDAYKAEYIGKIESIPNWGNNDFLVSLHQRLSRDGVLSRKQREALERQLSRRRGPERPERPGRPDPAPRAPAPSRGLSEMAEKLLIDLRALWLILPEGRDKEFVADLGKKVGQGRGWSEAQGRWVDSLLRRHNRAMPDARRRVQQRRASDLPF